MRTGRNREPERKGQSQIPVEPSSGNVFEDLGLADSAERLAKAEIALRIASIIEKRSLSQSAAARLLGVDQADVSDLVRGRLRGFSSDRLIRFLTGLGQDVDIVMPGRINLRRPGRLRVVRASSRASVVAGRKKK